MRITSPCQTSTLAAIGRKLGYPGSHTDAVIRTDQLQPLVTGARFGLPLFHPRTARTSSTTQPRDSSTPRLRKMTRETVREERAAHPVHRPQRGRTLNDRRPGDGCPGSLCAGHPLLLKIAFVGPQVGNNQRIRPRNHRHVGRATRRRQAGTVWGVIASVNVASAITWRGFWSRRHDARA